MKTLWYLVCRNNKLFFKDKGVFFAAMIAPLILLLLFATFLGNVYRDSFRSMLPEGVAVPDKLVEAFAGGWLFSSLLAVCCVTVAFTANLIMVQDKVTGSISDLTITPVRRSVISLGYFISTALVTLLICYVAVLVGFIYLIAVGWYLSAADVFFVLLDVLLLVLFGTAFSSVVCYFLRSQGGITAVSAIVSSTYGFLCGAYMPLSQFSAVIRNFVMFLPGTYGTALLRADMMEGVLGALQADHLPAEAVDAIRTGFDGNLYFFSHKVEAWTMYLVLVLSIAALTGVYVLLHFLKRRKPFSARPVVEAKGAGE